MKLFFYFARAYPWQSLIVVLCLLLSGLLEGLGWGAVLPVLSVAVAEEGPHLSSGLEDRIVALLTWLGVPRELGPLLVFVVVAFCLKGAVLLIANRRVGYTVAHVATDMRLRLLRALLTTSWSYYTRQPIGRAANAMATEADRGARAYYELTQVLTHLSEALIAIALVTAISWKVTLASLFAGFLSIGLLNVFVRMAARAGRRQTLLFQSLLGRLTDVLQSVKALKATAREPLVAPLLERDTKRLNKALRKAVLSKEALNSLQEPLLISFCAIALLVGLRGFGIPFTEMLVVIGLSARTLGALNKAQRKQQTVHTLESAHWSLLHMIEGAEAQLEQTEGEEPPHLAQGVALREVVLEYEGRRVLDRISLEIPAGRITAIIGASGSGKTSVVDLVTGLLKPDSGSIEVDGVPLSRLDLRAWRRMIGYVPQETLLLNDSVRLNVSLGDPQLDDAEVERALRDAGAWEYVSQHPEGLDAPVGERGVLLSGGQRQRLVIARALVHRPKLLILDEATASLDPDNEAAVWATVSKLRGRTTVVAISHQPALAVVADRIYRIERHGAELLPAPDPELAPAEGVA